MFSRAVLMFIAALGLPARTRAQVDTLARIRSRAGCYALALGPWSGSPPPAGVPTIQTPPSRFRLDTAVDTRPSGRFAVQPARLGPGRMAASWALEPNDSLSLFWSTGFVGVSLRLAIRGDSLIGTATTFHDAHLVGEPPDPTASVVATRTACPSRELPVV